VILVGGANRTQFTFQLGPPGGKRGYEAIANVQPGRFVWYVNGYMAPELWLLRGQVYSFVVQGGSDQTNETLNNPLYISDDQTGGYKRLSGEERAQIRVLAGLDTDGRPQNDVLLSNTAGKLCAWVPRAELDPDAFEDFAQFKKTLKLRCNPAGVAGRFQFRPNKDTPDSVHYQSYTNYNMGGKIMVVDEIPQDIPDTREDPYDYDEYMRYQKALQEAQKNGHKGAVSPGGISRKPAQFDYDMLNRSSRAAAVVSWRRNLLSVAILSLCLRVLL